MENWKSINNFSRYVINAEGEIRSLLNGKLLKKYITDGHETVNICNDEGKWRTRRVQSLVFEHFLDAQWRENIHKDIVYLVNKIKRRNYLIDAIDMFKIAHLHVDIFGDCYSNYQPFEQIDFMFRDLMKVVKEKNGKK